MLSASSVVDQNDRILMLPGPTDIPDVTYRAMTSRMINHRDEDFRQLHRETLSMVRKVIGADSGDVFVLTCSSTGGIEAAVANLLDRNDRVLSFVNGLFAERMTEAARYYSDRVEAIELPLGTAPTLEKVRSEVESKGADAVLLVHNETSTGAYCSEVPAIADYCRRNGIALIVDGVTSIGGYPLELSRWGVTCFVGGTQKCLAAPPGLAILYISDEGWERVRRKQRRPHYFDLIAHKEFMKKWETPFTPAVSLFFALHASLRYITETVGLERWFANHASGAAAFYEGLERMGIEIFPAPEFRSRTLIAGVLPDGITDADLTKTMKERYGVHIAGGMGKTKGKIFRIGNMGMVTPERVSRTLEALAGTLRALGFKVNDVNVRSIVEKRFGS
ncbi:MAG: alanine--glyoxylate aminotransferase family protein [Candidatus Calditenuis sp.]|nr:alanine--glyoxylate aminotransferase family protein [Candidatus Calditenuis sp.]